MDNLQLLDELASIIGDREFKSLSAKPNAIEFNFQTKGNAFQRLAVLLDSLNIVHTTLGNILAADLIANDHSTRIFISRESLFYAVAQNPAISGNSLLLVIDPNEGYVYDPTNGGEVFKPVPTTMIGSWIENLKTYTALLKMFRENQLLAEFNDTTHSKLMVVDNGKEKNNVIVNYKIYDPRIFTKTVNLDLSELKGRIADAEKIGNAEWLALLRHHIVAVMSAQEATQKTFAEIFLNIAFILQATARDYEIYVSGFSFDKISKDLKEDRQKYFNNLNQAQDKIKSQVIAVPLSVGTSIYAFYQLNTSHVTLNFLLIAIAIYIGFIWWYLMLYEADLNKLKEDIETDGETFSTNYPKTYKLFEGDFKYILKKVRSVKLLSWVIRGVTLTDWVLLAIYVFFFYKQNAVGAQFNPKFALGYF